MVSIVLLADRARFIELVTRREVVPGAVVRVADGIEDALTGISGRGPFFFLIQERIGELSGEYVASRLAAELKGRTVRFLFLGNAASVGDTFHGIVDDSLTDEEMAETIRIFVSAPLPDTRKRKRPLKKQAAVESPAASPVPVSEPATDSLPSTEDIEDIVLIGQPSSSIDRTPHQQPAFRVEQIPNTGTRFLDVLENALEESVAPDARSEETPEREALPRGEFPSGPVRGTRDTSIATAEVRARLLRPAQWFFLLGALAVGVLFLSLTLCRTEMPPVMEEPDAKSALPPPAENPATSPAPPRSLRTLPSFVPIQSPDPGYGKERPGWERYRKADADFRIYREKGLILAIQVIDRSGAGLAPGLLSSALTEIAGSPNYLVETRESKESYRIEKGRLRNGTGIIIYRKEPERKVTAFVVDFR